MAKALDSAVFVTDIPYITDDVEEVKDKLEKYFGQTKHGGGDIENIICPVGGALARAIVVFESPKDADSVVQRGKHVFEDANLDVKKLPPVCSLIEVDLEQYYWDVIPREKTESFINDLKRDLSPTRNVSCQKYSVQKVSGTYEELERMEEDILQLAGFGMPQGASAVVGARQVLSRCVEVTNIPYLTDDVQKLKTTLCEEIKQASKVTVTDVIAPIKGNMARAMVVFASSEDRKYYLEQSSHPLDGEELKLDIPPKVFRNSSVALDKFYKAMIPKKNSAELQEKWEERFGTDVSFNGKEIKAPFEYLNDVIDAWMEGTGLAQRKDCAISSDTTAKGEETDLPADEERDTDLQRFSSVPGDSWEKIDADGTEEEIPQDNIHGQVVDNELTQDLSGQHEEEINREENPSENDSFIVIDDKASNGDLTDVSKGQEPVFQTTSQPHVPTDKTADVTQDTNQDLTVANDDLPLKDEEKDEESRFAEEGPLGAGNGNQIGETEEVIATEATAVGNENEDKFRANIEDSDFKESGDQQMLSTTQTQNLPSPVASNENHPHSSMDGETTQETGALDLMKDDFSNAGALDNPVQDTTVDGRSDNEEPSTGTPTPYQSTVPSSRGGSDRPKSTGITLAPVFPEAESTQQYTTGNDMDKSGSSSQRSDQHEEDNSHHDSEHPSEQAEHVLTESDPSQYIEETNSNASTTTNAQKEYKMRDQSKTKVEKPTTESVARENELKIVGSEDEMRNENGHTKKTTADKKDTQFNLTNDSLEMQSNTEQFDVGKKEIKGESSESHGQTMTEAGDVSDIQQNYDDIHDETRINDETLTEDNLALPESEQDQEQRNVAGSDASSKTSVESDSLQICQGNKDALTFENGDSDQTTPSAATDNPTADKDPEKVLNGAERNASNNEDQSQANTMADCNQFPKRSADSKERPNTTVADVGQTSESTGHNSKTTAHVTGAGVTPRDDADVEGDHSKHATKEQTTEGIIGTANSSKPQKPANQTLPTKATKQDNLQENRSSKENSGKQMKYEIKTPPDESKMKSNNQSSDINPKTPLTSTNSANLRKREKSTEADSTPNKVVTNEENESSGKRYKEENTSKPWSQQQSKRGSEKIISSTKHQQQASTELGTHGSELATKRTSLQKGNILDGKVPMGKDPALENTGDVLEASGSPSGTDVTPDVQIPDFFTIEAITYRCLMLSSGDQLQKICSKFNVVIDIQTPDINKPADQIVVFKPRYGATVQDQMKNAKEEFIKLYQDIFYKVKRVPLKCEELPERIATKAQAEVQRRHTKVVVQKDPNGFIFGGDEKDVQDAIATFRKEAGIEPKPRRLKRKRTSEFGYEGDEYVYSANQESAAKIDGLPNDFPSAFCSKQGLQMIVLQDDITKQNVDVIVNAANGQLKHNGGVAAAISRAAGKQLQQDCFNIMCRRKPLQTTECIETRGYKLPSKYVIHAVGPVFANNQYQNRANDFFEQLTRTFINILSLAETKGAQSIAIPLISSGNYGGPKTTCANALATALHNFCSSTQRKLLKQVFLVNIDKESTTILQSTLAGVFLSKEGSEDRSDEQDASQENPSKSAKYTTNEGIEVVVTQGDITKGNVEVIVNAANGKLLHGGGVAGAIARAAGRRIQDECDQIIAQRGRPLDVGEFATTEGYNMKCRVIHSVGPVYRKGHSDKDFFDHLKKTFVTAIKHANLPMEAKEVALPLVSSGIFGGPNQLCAKALAQAVEEFSRSERNLVLKRIFLVNIDKETTDDVRRACEVCFSDAPGVRHANPQQSRASDSDDIGLTSTRGITLSVVVGDITKQQVDVIVNPTSPTLQHGGEVAKAISKAAGHQLQIHCNHIFNVDRKKQPLAVGETVVTNSFGLPCENIIHTIGPTLNRQNPNIFGPVLQKTFHTCLQLANNAMSARTIAFPLISSSTGPTETCAKAFAEAILELDKSGGDINLKKVTMVTHDNKAFATVQSFLRAHFSPEPEVGTDVVEQLSFEDERYPEYVFRTAENMEIRVRTDDVAKQATDVIFNYTDDKMTNRRQNSKRLCEAAGPKLQKECNDIIKKRKSLSKGSYLATDGFQLPCKKVIHLSIPSESGEPDENRDSSWMTRAYMSCFLFAKATLQAKTTTVPLLEADEASPTIARVYATALASSLKQLSKQTQGSMVIYVVNMTSQATDLVRKVFADHFQMIQEVKGISMPKERKAWDSTHLVPQSKDHMKNSPGNPSFDNQASSNQGNSYAGALKRGSTSGVGGNTTSHRTPGKGNSTPTLLQLANGCGICKTTKVNIHSLEGCGHKACMTCIQQVVTPHSACQECAALYGLVKDQNFGGSLKYYRTRQWTLEGKGPIVMEFQIPNGIQNTSHPRPGGKFLGMSTTAFLPDTKEGNEVLNLIRWAFQNGHMFQISASPFGDQDRVILGDIPLKRKTVGGSRNNGYPDRNYLPRVKEIVKKMMSGVSP